MLNGDQVSPPERSRQAPVQSSIVRNRMEVANHLVLNGNGVGQALNNTVPPPLQHESPVNVLTNTTHHTTNPAAAASIMGVKNNNNVDSDINPYLCLFFPVTAGIQGLGLGSDEEEIVLLVYILVDPETNKVVNIQQYLVKPRTADINENILSEQCLTESTLTEELVKAAMPVEVALEET
ncbi:hypothetical protein B566_EDAN014903 [Ephemera danica]|nr:hypothetical protein B566_EDAN014903 [Ephemera danica]